MLSALLFFVGLTLLGFGGFAMYAAFFAADRPRRPRPGLLQKIVALTMTAAAAPVLALAVMSLPPKEGADALHAAAPPLAVSSLNVELSEKHAKEGEMLLTLGYWEEAVQQFDLAIAINPNNADALRDRGFTHNRLGHYRAALSDLTQAIALDERIAAAHHHRAVVYAKIGDVETAVAGFSRAIELRPEYASAFSKRAALVARRGAYGDAERDFLKAIEIDPDEPDTLRRLAWLYATCPRENYRKGAEAVRLAEQAVALDKQNDWRRPEALAAAYAETGDFEKAVYWQDRAIELSPVTLENEAIARKALYTVGQPYRDDSRF